MSAVHPYSLFERNIQGKKVKQKSKLKWRQIGFNIF